MITLSPRYDEILKGHNKGIVKKVHNRYKKTVELVGKGGIVWLPVPGEIDRAVLEKFHEREYLREINFDEDEIARIDYTIAASELHGVEEYLDRGGLFFLGGGFHHETPKTGTFGRFNDVGIVLKHLEERFPRRMVIDLDCHHGNGLEIGFYDDPTVLYFSMHREDLWPHTGKIVDLGSIRAFGFNVNYPLRKDVEPEEYLGALSALLEYLVSGFRPEFIVYIAGADIDREDGFAGLSEFGVEEIIRRDLVVREHIRKANVPHLVVLGGGWGVNAPEIHYNTWRVFAGDLPGKRLQVYRGGLPPDRLRKIKFIREVTAGVFSRKPGKGIYSTFAKG